jgi:23S rRNA (guanine2445-N2)-methyltransferase / 23S rRNA (guanine2069-N7)-methyltransferase
VSAEATAQRRQFFAACPRHVPELLADELRALGIEVTRTHPAGVGFEGPLEHGLLACLHSRTASRIVLSLVSGPSADAEQFYDLVRAVPWEEHVAAEGSIAIDVVGDAPAWVRRTTYAAQKAKDAIVDRFRERDGVRPSVDFDRPDLRVSVRFGRDNAAIGIDLTGPPLHQRGYRQSAGEAPLKENLAAALLLRCGWPGIAAAGGAFVDPMCGSGTLVIEAALMAARIAPGLLRRRFGSSAGGSTTRKSGSVCARRRSPHGRLRRWSPAACAASTATRWRSAPRLQMRTAPASAKSSCSSDAR